VLAGRDLLKSRERNLVRDQEPQIQPLLGSGRSYGENYNPFHKPLALLCTTLLAKSCHQVPCNLLKLHLKADSNPSLSATLRIPRGGYLLDSGNACILWSRGTNFGGPHCMLWRPE
jgi:hypothetical protein